ncbi:vacuole membrane protein KMS1-like isoform X1 [Zingiber officinale]|uniref:vacuole membrane protein KMS1-like isoform X1 n=1 Tax=Zingiber officinale TaxID=94328 RepID=UPI001C4BB99E|nr:vacuole membrane protein KMS1-like isoform X1 [Zingiber officinale]
MDSGEVVAPGFTEALHPSIKELKKKHQRDLQNLTLATQPFKTFYLFVFATLQYLRQSLIYILRKGRWIMALTVLFAALGFFLMNDYGSNEKHIVELLHYSNYVLWWVALGVASSIGLGSGLHTFVLYLGPHIAFFTIKAMKCGRVDLKTASYDTIQLKRRPSWLEKGCSEFGPPVYHALPGSLVRIPICSILPQVQLEAILWGLGTALGELPPYFISRAASLSGNKMELEELDAVSTKEDSLISAFLKKIKRWFFTHSQHLNFLTILILASVPNPLFDLAGIMCGQFGIPFWKFFLATLIGKALIKTHIQTVFIISLCNNQLLEWLENELIWALGLIPGLSSVLPNIIAKLRTVQGKYLSSPVPESPQPDGTAQQQWNLSFTMIWNTVILLVLANFFVKIVTATAKRYLKEQQELELANQEKMLNSLEQ